MWVAMVISISGGRADGRPWPNAGYLLELPDAEGEDLIRGRMAVQVPVPQPVQAPVSAPPPAAPPVQAPVSAPPQTAAGPVPAEPGTASAAEPAAAAGQEMEQPKPADPKQAWVDYAVSQGADLSAVADVTKQQLMQAYGGRL